MKVAIVGSRTLDLGEVAYPLLDALTRLPMGVTVLVRQPKDASKMEEFELLTVRLCKALDIDVAVRYPNTGTGRAGTFERDISMVEESDAVIAYFDPEHVMQGGTGHVVEKAIDKETPVYAYQVDETGAEWVGGIEPPDINDILRKWPTSLSPRKR